MNKTQIISQALMIVGGYAFIPNADNVTITSINESGHATLISKDTSHLTVL
ncbi:MAG: hypothetical protein HUK00_07645 [Bacteroidaceae bacterium]|nr:hypothetical protein [Bacteroidaceae bacterium]